MRIERVQVYGFGEWQDVEWQFEPGLNVILGRNEAGKTTVMAFVRAVLFGFERRSAQALHLRYEPRGGGGYGGAVTLVDAAGARYRIERTGTSRSAGDVRVYLPDGTTGGEEQVHLLLGKMNDKVFKNIFAFGLTELQQLETLQTEEVNGFLYRAGTGSGLSILQVQKKLEGLEESYFKKGGKSKQLKLLTTGKSLEREQDTILDLQRENETYNRCVRDLQAVEGRIDEQTRLVEAGEERVKRQDVLLQQEETYEAWREQERRLQALPVIAEFPQDGVARLEQLLERRREVEAEIEGLTARERKESAVLDGLVVREDVLAAQEQILRLRDQVPLVRDRVQSLREQSVRIEALDGALAQFRRVTGLDWEEERIAAFDFSFAHKQALQEQAEQERSLREAGNGWALRERELREKAEDLQKREGELLERQEALPKVMSDEERVQAEDALNWLREQLPRAESLRQSQEHLAEQISRDEELLGGTGRTAAKSTFRMGQSGRSDAKPSFAMEKWVLAALAVLLPLILLVLGSLLPALIVFLVLGALAALKWRTPAPGKASSGDRASMLRETLAGNRAHFERLRREQDDLQAQAARLLAPHGLAFVRESLRTLEERLRRDDERRQDRQRWEEQWRDLIRDQDVQDLAVARLNRDKDAHRRERDAWQASWTSWLSERGLPTEWTPSLTEQTLPEIEKARDAVRQKREGAKLAAGWRDFVDNLEREARTLAERLGDKAAFSTDLSAIIHKLSSCLQDEERKASQRAHLTDKLSTVRDALQEKQNLLRAHLDAQAQLFRSADAADEETFRRRAAQFAERTRRLDERDRLHAILLRSAGGEAAWVKFCAEMEAADADQRREALTAEKVRLAELRAVLQGLQEEKGSLKQKLSSLETSERLSEARQNHRQLTARLEREADEWSVYAVARHLLQRTMGIYEREKQPAVIKRAADYFRRLTEGRYTGVYVPLGDKRIEVERQDGHRFEPAYLSRGTVEQLYLAMRFALVHEYRQSVALPLVLDDIFVNFDPERTKAALRTLVEIAGEQQILFFTCHPHISGCLREMRAEHHLLSFESSEHAKTPYSV
ncbi:AAA family ATPase [Tumebacillus sp. DT12]|uniref:AAA family ATPase n=1 Tax=Tumebacillus lacus TaxID=2995335 RepID=A0ABT3X877_9BACL|nr:AAA family ATPase [Tumebacillus lacus]MCX7571810.1 AAA family ATPase [Tumebacillus lacus]